MGESYPARPVRIFVGFAAGQAIDIIVRVISQWLSDQLGQQFVVENRPGAGGNIATEVVVRSPPDGYTLIAVGMNNMINATLYEKLSFNFIRDIAPVASILRARPSDAGEPVRSGQDGSRIHHLCQSQSRQDQHGVSG